MITILKFIGEMMLCYIIICLIQGIINFIKIEKTNKINKIKKIEENKIYQENQKAEDLENKIEAIRLKQLEKEITKQYYDLLFEALDVELFYEQEKLIYEKNQNIQIDCSDDSYFWKWNMKINEISRPDQLGLADKMLRIIDTDVLNLAKKYNRDYLGRPNWYIDQPKNSKNFKDWPLDIELFLNLRKKYNDPIKF